MSVKRSEKRIVFRTGFLGLLAGSLWFSAGTAALAQDDTASPQASQAARTDADIQSDVGHALMQDPTLKGQQIACTAANGIVTLSGTVQTDPQRQQAETVAANVSGVAGILNNIQVAHPANRTAESSAAEGAQQTANAPADSSDSAQANVPPPPPDMDPNQEGNQSQAAPPAQGGSRPPYQPQQQGGYGYPPKQQGGYGYPPQQQGGYNYPPQQQGGYGYPPQQQGGYGYPPQQQPYNPPPVSGPVTIPAGTLLRVRLSEPLDTAKIKSGEMFQATAAADVYQNGVVAIPRGAVLQGEVVFAKNAGDLGGSAELRLQLTGVNLGGNVFPIATDTWSSKGPNKAGYTVANTIGIAGLGAIIGGIAGGGAGAAIGAGVGGIGGLAASSATRGPRLILPPEALVDFHLTDPVTVQPVSWQEAQRLAASVPQQPRLVLRPRPYYAYPYPPYAYPYPYPYPYYYYGRVY